MSAFLGIAEDRVDVVPPDNSRVFVGAGLRTRLLGRVVRAGARAGAQAPPQLWRRVSRPLLAALQHGGADQRPALSLEQRSELLADCLDDIAVLESVLEESFDDWRSAAGRGSFRERTAP